MAAYPAARKVRVTSAPDLRRTLGTAAWGSASAGHISTAVEALARTRELRVSSDMCDRTAADPPASYYFIYLCSELPRAT